MTRWLLVLLGFFFLLLSGQITVIAEVFTTRDVRLFYSINILQIITGIGLAGLLISPFFSREFCTDYPVFLSRQLKRKSKLPFRRPFPQ